MSNTNFNYNFRKRKKNLKISLDSRSKDTLHSVLREAQNTSDELMSIIKSAIEKGITKSISDDTPIASTVSGRTAEPEQEPPSNEGKRIKNNIINVLNKNHNAFDIKGVFDNVSDSDVEKSIPTAKSVILDRLNSNNGKSGSRNDYNNLRDGLALFYAASEKSDKKAANLAYKAAYTPSKKEASESLYETSSRGTTVTEESSTDPVSFQKEASNHQSLEKNAYKPNSGKTYGLISRPPQKIGRERIF